MTYDQDPARWTASPDEAPELLRGAFASAHDEGPSRMQMRSLALKIAAASAGGAVAVGTVKAASAGQAVATAASWSVGKIATVVALAGTLATTGAVVWHTSGRSSQEAAAAPAAQRPPAAAPAAGDNAAGVDTTSAVGASALPSAEPAASDTAAASNAGARPAPPRIVDQLAAQTVRVAPETQTVRAAPETNHREARAALSEPKPSLARGAGKTSGAVLGARSAAPQSARTATSTAQATTTKRASGKAEGNATELELLRRAQVALQARPREAFQLTQEHRRLYPSGEFAQERDALAIQALMRAGETEMARDLAESFIRAHPSSPHAHRFREAMGVH